MRRERLSGSEAGRRNFHNLFDRPPPQDRPRTLGLRLSRLAAWLMSMSGGLVPLIYTV